MIESEVSSVAYSGNASTTTVYVVPFPYLDPDHVRVIVTDSGGTDTTLTAGTDYTLSSTAAGDGTGYTGGALTTAAAVPATSTVTVKRVTPIVQGTDYPESGRFPAASHEAALDKLTLIAQEIRRDASPADSSISASGTGMVAQTVEGTFAVRTVTPASGSGLAVTNGDGVAGNPTIDTDFSTLPVVTALADSDLVPVRASGAESAITAGNLRADLANGSYGSFFALASDMVPAASNGATVATVNYTAASEVLATFAASGTNSAFLRVILPGDYNGGTVKMKLHQRDGSLSVISGTVAWQTRAAKATHQASTLDISGSFTVTVESNFVGVNYYVKGAAITLGSGWSAGDAILIEIKRDTAHANDTRNATAQIAAVEFQYPRVAVTSAW